jgi:hypothetical protein
MDGTCVIYWTNDKFIQNFGREQEERVALERPMVEGMTILKWVIKKCDMSLWPGFMRVWTGTSGEHF